MGVHGPSQNDNHGNVLNLTSHLGVFPASSVDAQASNPTETSDVDIVSRGIISEDVAGECLSYFLKHLNQFLHSILDTDATLTSLRARSSLLTTAVCTVACFCSASSDYRNCNEALVAEVSGKLFASRYDYDDVRALCIASFWLDHMAPTLSGLGESAIIRITRGLNVLMHCSCPGRLATGPASLHNQNATYQKGLLRPDTAVLPGLLV